MKETSERLKPGGTVSLSLSNYTGMRTDNKVVTCFRTSKVGIKVTQNSVWCLEKVGLVPKGTYDVGEALVVAAQNLVEGGRSKLFT